MEWLLEIRQNLGKRVEALEKRPVLYDDVRYIWEAFWVLTRSRSVGWSVGPIPLSEIRAYIDLFPVPDIGVFVACIHGMDRVYLEHHHKKLDDANQS